MLNEIKTVFGAISVDHVKEHTYKPGIYMAQIRQLVDKIYPAMRVGNSHSDMLVEIELPEGKSFQSTRVAWVAVRKGMTIEDVEKLLAACPKPRIYRRISNVCDDVLTDEQRQSITAGLKTMEEYEESYRVKTSDGSEIEGPAQYSQHFFSKTGKEDVDLRTSTVTTPQANAEAEASDVMGAVTA